MSENPIIEEILNRPYSNPDLIIDGINFGRGDLNTTQPIIKCWRISNEKLVEEEIKPIQFYNEETYIIQWDYKNEHNIFFYWKGDNASKGYSPLPEDIEKDNPPVERITQWSEPPAFLRLFSGTLMVHKGKYGTLTDSPRLYILRGEIEEEVHFYEVTLKRSSLRSRTSFILVLGREEEKVIIWHGTRSSIQSRKVIKKSVEKIFKYKITEIEEGFENEEFLKLVNGDDYFVDSLKDIMSYTPRLFYFNNITGDFMASEVECSHRSEFNTSFPFLQAHLYTATQPATFLLDDNSEIWLWQGWQRYNEDDNFRSECFSITIDYAKMKSKLTGKLIKVHKVIAGFEPSEFINLFPTWNKREDVVELQKKDDVVPNTNLLIEVTPQDDNQK